jgi:hypothetical protein
VRRLLPAALAACACLGAAAQSPRLPAPRPAPGVPVEAKKPGTNAALRDEILAMHDAHQNARQSKDAARMKELEARHLKRMKEIVAKHGWPTDTLVGEHGASAAWLLVHHADSDREFQLRVLKLMEPLVAKQEASGQLYAYLHDRTHKPQRYGTQGSCMGPGAWQPREMEDPKNVDARRAAIGLAPAKLIEYSMIVSQNCK